MKATVRSIYDEGSLVNTRLIGAKGFSVMVDVDDKRIMLDTGRKGSYLKHNMDHLEIPFDSVDMLVLSHGHRDHVGALNMFLAEREGSVDIYAHPGFWDGRAEKVAGIRKDIGPPEITEENAEKAVVHEITEWTQLSEHLFIMPMPPAEPSGKFMRSVDGQWTADTFDDELALVLMSRAGPVLICGGCHCGLPAAMEKVKEMTGRKVNKVIGSTYLVKARKDALAKLGDEIIAAGQPLLYLNHNAVPDSRTGLRVKLGLKGVMDFYVGTEVTFDV